MNAKKIVNDWTLSGLGINQARMSHTVLNRQKTAEGMHNSDVHAYPNVLHHNLSIDLAPWLQPYFFTLHSCKNERGEESC